MPREGVLRITKRQSEIAGTESGRVFLEGIAGTGKTTAGCRRLHHLIDAGVPAESILILVPQKALALPYYLELRTKSRKAGGRVTVATIGSLSLHMVETWWPLVAEEVGFTLPFRRPHFLDHELVQYYMMRVVGPAIDRNDYFSSVRINRNRLYSQIIDNLNKAAVVGFPADTIAGRLKSAWGGETGQYHVYDDVQTCANLFHNFRLQNNVLDFSLQVHLFVDFLWNSPQVREHLTGQYRHLIVDNIEEDNPATHRIVGDWLEVCASALLIYDTDAGYRRFLGSDAVNGYQLKQCCDEHVTWTQTFVMSADMQAFHAAIAASLDCSVRQAQPPRNADMRAAIVYRDNRYHTEMINYVAEDAAALVHNDGVPPGEIAILAPFLPDALRFSLMKRLESAGVPVRSHRPSRALRDEPPARSLLSFAKIAHPHWGMSPSPFDVTYALMVAVAGLDLTRAHLLVKTLYRSGTLQPFTTVTDARQQQRITRDIGSRYEALVRWLADYQKEVPAELDIFFSSLFGEVLSQPGFGFNADYNAANIAANLVDSARNFRWTVSAIEPEIDTGREYARMVEDGVIAGSYLRDWDLGRDDSVLVAPAYTFLMSNRAVDYQFWLNIGSPGWGQRLYQPLTHPYVLSKQWEVGRLWTDDDEDNTNRESLYRLLTGLIRRCRKQVYLGFSRLGEQGYEQRGPALDAVQRALRQLMQEADDV